MLLAFFAVLTENKSILVKTVKFCGSWLQCKHCFKIFEGLFRAVSAAPYPLCSLGSQQWSDLMDHFWCPLTLFRSDSPKHVLEMSSGVHKHRATFQSLSFSIISSILCGTLGLLFTGFGTRLGLYLPSFVRNFPYLYCDSRDKMTERDKNQAK